MTAMPRDQVHGNWDAGALGGAPWLADVRARGRAAFDAVGLPTRKVEPWRYTNLNRLAKADFALATPDAATAAVPKAWHLADAIEVVFVNGVFQPAASDLTALPAGVTIETLANVDADAGRDLGHAVDLATMPLAALNTAFVGDGIVLRVADNVAAPTIHLLSITDAAAPVAFHPRHIVAVGAGAKAHLVVSHRGAATEASFANAVFEIDVARDAALRHDTLQGDGPAATNIAAVQVNLADNAAYDGFVLQAGAALARHEVNATLVGAHADFALAGAYLAAGDQHLDTTFRVAHAAPHGRSRQAFRGVLDDKGHGVFQGAVAVARAAQKTDANQHNQVLLLSDGARIDAKPELEIYADDVKCGHGATAGQLDDAAIFYLQSRGLPEAVARRLLVEGFIADGIAAVPEGPFRTAVESAVAAWLAERSR